MGKKSVIIGATPNPERYAFAAANRLVQHDHPIVPLGIKKGTVAGAEILDIRKKPEIDGVDTVTLYLGPHNQKEWEDYILSLNPKRIIFNPGTENDSLKNRARERGILTEDACTLVLLSTNTY